MYFSHHADPFQFFQKLPNVRAGKQRIQNMATSVQQTVPENAQKYIGE